ncbi:VAMP-associated protein [Cerioporus squamosus]|nr:VAMP-associated protein [Cerioporus squamosus]
MSVSLNPSSVLGFNRPFTQSVKRALQITNNNAQPVAFKVKTTAPKLYCVRPNSGRVEPGETVEVAVMLQAMKEDLPINAKCKDKFLIQSTIISPEKESMPLNDIWNVEGDEVHSQKIRVVYLPPEGQTVPEEDETHANMSSLLAVPGQDNYATVRQYPETNGHATREPSQGDDSAIPIPPPQQEEHHDAPSTPPQVAVHPPEPQSSEPQPSSDDGVGVVNVSVHAPHRARSSPPPSPPVRAAPPLVQDPNPELVKKLEEAQHEIERLRQLIASMPEPSIAPTTLTSGTELRSRRRGPVSDDGSSTYDGRTYDGRSTYDDGRTDVSSYVGSEVGQPEGVPLQVVIIIALGVFVTTYLFF